MITTYQSDTKPSILAFTEGLHTNIYFDFELLEDDMYSCRYIHLMTRDYKDIVSAIIQEKYTYEDAENILMDSVEEPTEEYEAFRIWRKHAKEVANQVIQIING